MTRKYGKLYDEKHTTKAIAEIVRRTVRLEMRMGALPAGKWSVTSERFAGGSSITIAFAPAPAEDECFARAYYNRERIVQDAERPHDHSAIPFRSAFGAALDRKLEQLLADFNYDGSDISTDYFDVNFYAHVEVRTKTNMTDLVELYRGGCLPEQPLSELSPAWAKMREGWEKEVALALEAPRTRGHLKLVHSSSTPTPVEAAATALKAGMTKLEREVVEIIANRARPLARARRPLAVPVEEPLPQAPNESWLRLVGDLSLDFTIPGLRS